MLEIRYVQPEDKGFWYRLDKHLSEQEFNHKISQKRGYVLLENHIPIGCSATIFSGIIHLFVPCCSLIGASGKRLWQKTYDLLGTRHEIPGIWNAFNLHSGR